MLSVMTLPVPYSFNMDIFDGQANSLTVPRIHPPSFPPWDIDAQAQTLSEPVSALSGISAESWLSNSVSVDYTTMNYDSTGTAYQYGQAYDRPWLFSPPSGFRKGLKKTDLRPVHAPTKARSQLPRAAKRSSPYARPEESGPSRRRGSDSGGSVHSANSSPCPEQLAKLEKRRRANAEAQRLSRQRKEETLSTLREEIDRLSRRTATLDEDLQRLRQTKSEVNRILQDETAKVGHLQMEIDSRRRRQVQGDFMQLQAEQGMTPMIGLTSFPDSFWTM
ncbi:hypothetical protein DACRYDRAFT_115618 [Dacryopinax primogenitus]|uniref:BZIP domain-containing protein n=1 Tax=Dacryopinax primogenitus (strain DJM 731) TaxID=1858805 RepID=M5G9M9_DACPD|nr:uncharacterized protein DACRYDRAFT_115618 [Dacryopinax primogenitus]EJU02572.1 hypothetical protein DACRYDRAFT_115618 [Dacryopinax primogenitus]